jgi:hydrogenase 3 maturation protease
LPSSWKKSLGTILARPAAHPTKPKIAILGIGNELNGDDAAGVLVVRRLKEQLAGQDGAGDSGQVLLIEAGLAPESFTGPIRRFGPDIVLMVDAASMDEATGSIGVLDWRDSTGFGPSTHLQPPSTLAEYLMHELGCAVALVGIQPAVLDFDAPVSDPVERGVEELVDFLCQNISL